MKRVIGSSILTLALLFVLFLRWDSVHSGLLSSIDGTVVDIDHDSNSFTITHYDRSIRFEQYHVQGDMPLGVGRCIHIEYLPKVNFGLFRSRDPHQIRIYHAFLTQSGSCIL